jgi:hypothetical protein
MPRFRERLQEVEADQFHHANTAPAMVKFEHAADDDDDKSKPYVLTPGKIRLYLKPGDWIITDGTGFKVMEAEDFEKKFQEI